MAVVADIIDGGTETVKIEELGVGQEVQVAVANVDVIAGEFVGRGDGVEVGQVLRHVRCAAAMVARRHPGGMCPTGKS